VKALREYVMRWIASLSVPRTEFGGNSACPFAKMARVVVCQVADAEDMVALLRWVQLPRWNVLVIMVADAGLVHERLAAIRHALAERDIIALPSDPWRPMVIDGFRTTQQDYFLVIAQRKSELERASREADEHGYYERWTSAQREWLEDRQ